MKKNRKVAKKRTTWQELSEKDPYQMDGWVLAELVWKRRARPDERRRDVQEKRVQLHELPKDRHRQIMLLFSDDWGTGGGTWTVYDCRCPDCRPQDKIAHH